MARSLPYKQQALKRIPDYGLLNIEAQFASLTQQVASLENDYQNLRSTLISLDDKMERGLSNVLSRLEAVRQPTPWGQIYSGVAVLLTMVSVVGWLALQPIYTDIADYKAQFWNERNARLSANDTARQRLNEVEKDVWFLKGVHSNKEPNVWPPKQ